MCSSGIIFVEILFGLRGGASRVGKSEELVEIRKFWQVLKLNLVELKMREVVLAKF